MSERQVRYLEKRVGETSLWMCENCGALVWFQAREVHTASHDEERIRRVIRDEFDKVITEVRRRALA